MRGRFEMFEGFEKFERFEKFACQPQPWRRLERLGKKLLTFTLTFTFTLTLTLLCGCKNTGTYATVGDISAPIDVSDASDNYSIKAFFSMKGAKAWSAKNSRTKVTYTNSYTNSYFGIVDTRGVQEFEVEVEPTVDEAETSQNP